MSTKQKLELTWIGKENWPRLEPKRADQITSLEVLAKKAAALEWCRHASDHAQRHGGLPWRYLLIPHDAMAGNMALDGLASRFAAR